MCVLLKKFTYLHFCYPFLLTGGETGEWLWKDRLGAGGFGEVS